MLEVTAATVLCLIAAGFALAIACACALMSRIAAAQRSAVGCFLLVGLFCCCLFLLALLTAFSG